MFGDIKVTSENVPKIDAKYKQNLITAIHNDIIIYPIVKDAFEQADKNHNGYIERKELENCMLRIAQTLGASKPDKDAIDEEFKKLDFNEDGVIDITEFQKFIRENLLKIAENC